MIISNTGVIKDKKSPPKFRLLAVGDCIPGGRAEKYFIDRGNNPIFDEIKPLLSNADIVLFNLETALCHGGNPILKCGANFHVNPETAWGLKDAGFNLAALANNHILDYGHEGLEETICALDDAKIAHHGAANTRDEAIRPLFREINGVKISFLNYAEGEFSKLGADGSGAAPLDFIDNKEAIEKARDTSDIVVVSVHAGNEYQHFPSPWIQKLYRQFIAYGATVVIGNHTHIPQGMEWYKEGLIVYSMGDFIFEYGDDHGTCTTFIIELDFDIEGITSARIHPIRKNDNVRMSFLKGREQELFINHLNRLSKPLVNHDQLTELWEQGLIRRLESFYADKLKKNISLVFSKRKEKEFAAGFLYNMFDCPSHQQALRTVFSLIHNDKFEKDKTIQEYLTHLNHTLEILGQQEPIESPRGYQLYINRIRNFVYRMFG